jgi:hypothetical protein
VQDIQKKDDVEDKCTEAKKKNMFSFELGCCLVPVGPATEEMVELLHLGPEMAAGPSSVGCDPAYCVRRLHSPSPPTSRRRGLVDPAPTFPPPVGVAALWSHPVLECGSIPKSDRFPRSVLVRDPSLVPWLGGPFFLVPKESRSASAAAPQIWIARAR